MSRLRKLTAEGATWLVDADSGQHVLDVATQHGLNRAAGYLKFADAAGGPVVFRGQRRLYGSLRPSLYRGIHKMGPKGRRDAAFNALRRQIGESNALISSTPNYARDPLLQHYGIYTKWIDLVDNVWVALWFACHRAVVVGDKGQYLHFERRSPRTDPNPYAYILLLQTGALNQIADKPGLLGNDHTLLIDLRIAAPSLYLRPHAQHALLLRRLNINSLDDLELLPMVVGTIRVHLADAFSWLGDGALLSPHSLFPPPTYDEGYRRLLSLAHLGSAETGAIAHVGA
jgi:hypothetical protein